MKKTRGYTLIELIVAVGLFALIMLLASGAYLMMISLNRQAQSVATGIDNLSFALETMTRNIRTGTAYNCGIAGGDCSLGGSSFSFTPGGGSATITYSLASPTIQEKIGAAAAIPLTDPSVNVSSLMFYVVGTKNAGNPPDDLQQPRVTIIISGTVSSGPGKTQSFTVETGATMRGTDL